MRAVADSLVALKDDADPELKKCAFEGLNAIAKGNFNSIRDLVGDIELFAQQETVVRPELIEEVDLGSFKIKVDKGLTMRKEAFSLLETLLQCTDTIDVDKFVDALVRCLSDPDVDILLLTLNILAKLSSTRSCVIILTKMDGIITAFEKLFKANLKLVSGANS